MPERRILRLISIVMVMHDFRVITER